METMMSILRIKWDTQVGLKFQGLNDSADF